MPLAAATLATATLVGAAVSLAGCGSDGSGSAPRTPEGTSTRQAQFPLTITRMGGVAGFSDTVSVQDDGTVLATTKAGRVTCTLESQALAALKDGAAEIAPTDTPSTPATPMPDGLLVVFSSGRGALSVDDPVLADTADTINQVLADVTGPAGERTLCR
jgi:hypothetical protein